MSRSASSKTGRTARRSRGAGLSVRCPSVVSWGNAAGAGLQAAGHVGETPERSWRGRSPMLGTEAWREQRGPGSSSSYSECTSVLSSLRTWLVARHPHWGSGRRGIWFLSGGWSWTRDPLCDGPKRQGGDCGRGLRGESGRGLQRNTRRKCSGPAQLERVFCCCRAVVEDHGR